MNKPSGILFGVAAAIMILVFAAQVLSHIFATSLTIDEGAHILAGHRHVQCGDLGINPEHPPLVKMLAGLSLAFGEWKEPNWPCGSRITPKMDMFDAATNFVVDNGIDTVVIPTRIAASLPTLLLILLIFAAAWEMFGRSAALIALGVAAFEPSIIGFGSLVLTDLGITAVAFATVYAAYRYGAKRTWPRFAVMALSMGLMFATKHSAVLFVPIIGFLMAADAVLFRRADGIGISKRFIKSVAAAMAVFLIGFVVLWAFYGFRYSSIPGQTAEPISIARYIKENGSPDQVASFGAKLTDIVNRAHLFPEAYCIGMADVIAWGSRNSFLFGVNYPTGKWFYFPVAFAVKSSVVLLLLMPLALGLPFILKNKRREAAFLLFPALAYFAIAMTSSMTIGIRHLMPVYPFFIVTAAGGAAWLIGRFSWAKYLLLTLFIHHTITAARVLPDYASFANDFWGGSSNIHRIFNDSNNDFGQNLKKIAAYAKENNITDCWVAAWNHAALQKAMTPCKVLPSGLRILVSKNVIEPLPEVIEGTVFISVNELPPRSGREYEPFTKGEQVAFPGGNIRVYRGRFEIPLAAAMSHAYRSGQLLTAGSFDDAIVDAKRSVELAGSDPRTHLALGLAMLKTKQKDKAQKEFEAVITMAREQAPIFRNAEVRALLELERLSSSNVP